MPNIRCLSPANLLVAAILFFTACASACAQAGHAELVQLFKDWRTFESPPLLDGAPDYSIERFEQRQAEYLELRKRLTRIRHRIMADS